MDNEFEIKVVIVIGAILILLFSIPFLSFKLPVFRKGAKKQKSQEPEEGTAGDPKTCPVCSAKLFEGQLVSSAAFPAAEGSKDRLMHIRGCTYCLGGKRERVCPVCYKNLSNEEILISRLFERSIKRSHVHVIGCSKCRGPRGLAIRL